MLDAKPFYKLALTYCFGLRRIFLSGRGHYYSLWYNHKCGMCPASLLMYRPPPTGLRSVCFCVCVWGGGGGGGGVLSFRRGGWGWVGVLIFSSVRSVCPHIFRQCSKWWIHSLLVSRSLLTVGNALLYSRPFLAFRAVSVQFHTNALLTDFGAFAGKSLVAEFIMGHPWPH